MAKKRTFVEISYGTGPLCCEILGNILPGYDQIVSLGRRAIGRNLVGIFL